MAIDPNLKNIIELNEFRSYCKTFVNRYNGYTIKKDDEWTTRHKTLSDIAIAAHIAGKYHVGCCGKRDVSAAILDFDDVSLDKIYDIRESIGLDESTSLLCTSASDNSYHLYFRPLYSEKPVTIPWLHDLLKSACRRQEDKNIELYPQKYHSFRLPFGPLQRIVSPDGQPLNNDFSEKMYWYDKIDTFDLNQPQFTDQLRSSWKAGTAKGVAAEGLSLLETGLVDTCTRNHAQWKVLYSFWRQNMPEEVAIEHTWEWINAKHNDLSSTMKTSPGKVYKDISSQAERIWGDYDRYDVSSNVTVNTNEYLTEEDIKDIIRITEGNLPQMKFLGNLVSYRNARQGREFLSIHSNILRKWSSIYMKHLDHLKAKGILTRKSPYSTDRFAKCITLKWRTRFEADAISPDLLEACSKIWNQDLHELINSLPISKQRRRALVKVLNAA